MSLFGNKVKPESGFPRKKWNSNGDRLAFLLYNH